MMDPSAQSAVRSKATVGLNRYSPEVASEGLDRDFYHSGTGMTTSVTGLKPDASRDRFASAQTHPA